MERFWFYARSGSDEKHGPISENEIRTLLSQGKLSGSDLVWSDGMTNWKPVNQMPEFSGGASRTAAGEPRSIPVGLEGWMMFVAVATMVTGILSCLSCAIIPGLFYILAGVALLGARNALANVVRVDPSLGEFFLKLKSAFRWTGIAYIAVLVLMLVVLVFYVIVFGAILSQVHR